MFSFVSKCEYTPLADGYIKDFITQKDLSNTLT